MSEEEAVILLRYKIDNANTDVYIGDLDEQNIKAIKVVLETNNQLKEENKELKKQLYSPDQVETICPKCGEKFLTNYSREVYDLKYILTELEKWLEEDIKKENEHPTPEIYHDCTRCKTIILEKLRELERDKNE